MTPKSYFLPTRQIFAVNELLSDVEGSLRQRERERGRERVREREGERKRERERETLAP